MAGWGDPGQGEAVHAPGGCQAGAACRPASSCFRGWGPAAHHRVLCLSRADAGLGAQPLAQLEGAVTRTAPLRTKGLQFLSLAAFLLIMYSLKLPVISTVKPHDGYLRRSLGTAGESSGGQGRHRPRRVRWLPDRRRH